MKQRILASFFILMGSLLLGLGGFKLWPYLVPPASGPSLKLSLGNHGNYKLLTFGFTRCPDICPTNMSKITEAARKLHSIFPLDLIFLSVDVSYDQDSVRRDFVQNFDDRILSPALSAQQVQESLRDLGAFAQIKGLETQHSPYVFLLHPSGAYLQHFNKETSQDIRYYLLQNLPFKKGFLFFILMIGLFLLLSGLHLTRTRKKS